MIDTAYSLATIRPDIDLRFSYYLIKLIGLNHLKDGTSNPTLSRDVFGRQALPIPPLGVQLEIANIAGSFDHKIALNRQLHEALEATAEALFKSWFVDFDPVHSKFNGQDLGLPSEIAGLFPRSFDLSDIGQIPTGWTLGRLQDLVTQTRDLVDPSDFTDDLFAHYSIPAFDEGQRPKEELGAEIKSTKFAVPRNAVLLSKLNPELARVWLPDPPPGKRSVSSTEFLVLQPTLPFARSYVYFALRSAAFRRRIEAVVTGTSRSHQRAQSATVLAIRLLVPPAPVIAAFDRIVASDIKRALLCQVESETLAGLRDWLLPQLISGAVRPADGDHFSVQLAP